MGPAAEQPDGAEIVGLDETIGVGRELAQHGQVTLLADQRQAGEHHLLAGRAQPFDRFAECRADEGHALGTHHLAQIDDVHWCLVGDAAIEVAQPRRLPEVEDRSQRQPRPFAAHRHLLS